MSLKIETLVLGPLDVNCYIAGCTIHKKCIVIDPGDTVHRIITAVRKNEWQVIAIVNTHCHADHIGANRKLKLKTQAPIIIHREEQWMLEHPDMIDMATFLGLDPSPPADRMVTEGEKIVVCDCISFETLHTPGHSKGSICLSHGDHMITGDTLFKHSIGRTDLLGGSAAVMRKSLERLKSLPDKTIIYPGHGDTSKMSDEKMFNPYLRGSF